MATVTHRYNMYGAVIMTSSHWESTSDQYRTSPNSCRPSD